MGEIVSQITSLAIIYSTVYSDADQRKHQSSASLAFVRGIHRGPVNSPHKWPVTRKMFPFNDVIMLDEILILKATLLNISNAIYHQQIVNVITDQCHGSIDCLPTSSKLWHGWVIIQNLRGVINHKESNISLDVVAR